MCGQTGDARVLVALKGYCQINVMGCSMGTDEGLENGHPNS